MIFSINEWLRLHRVHHISPSLFITIPAIRTKFSGVKPRLSLQLSPQSTVPNGWMISSAFESVEMVSFSFAIGEDTAMAESPRKSASKKFLSMLAMIRDSVFRYSH